MSIAYIALGANLGQPVVQVQNAIHLLHTLPQTQLVNASSLYRTAPWGYLDQPDFINAVAAVDTSLTVDELFIALIELEQSFGRTRPFKNAPRTLDLDLLLYDDLTIESPSLTLPHPRMTERPFVMIPLQEIAPDIVIAGQGKVQEICARLDHQYTVVDTQPNHSQRHHPFYCYQET